MPVSYTHLDVYKRQRLLLAGILLFTAASLLCGVAPTLWLLIAARAAQGLGAAIMMALTIAFVGETVAKEKTGSAMGLLGTMSAPVSYTHLDVYKRQVPAGPGDGQGHTSARAGRTRERAVRQRP